jgi:hypothetical protein
MPAPSRSDRERLAKLLGTLGSEHAGERDNADKGYAGGFDGLRATAGAFARSSVGKSVPGSSIGDGPVSQSPLDIVE